MDLLAKDLRIGNHVQDYNERLVIVARDTIYSFEYYQRDQNTALIPIPLTEEILLKCGFRKKVAETFSGGYEHYIKYFKQTDTKGCQQNSIFSLGRKGTEVFINNTWLCGIQHLHQLQNLYFALTGKELEITL